MLTKQQQSRFNKPKNARNLVRNGEVPVFPMHQKLQAARAFEATPESDPRSSVRHVETRRWAAQSVLGALDCAYPQTRNKTVEASPSSQTGAIAHTPDQTLISPVETVDDASQPQHVQSDLPLALPSHRTPHSQDSPFVDSAVHEQQPGFDYDMSTYDIDWDFPINWLPYDNDIETNYYSILGLDMNQPLDAGNATVIDQPVPSFPIIDAPPRRLSAVTSLSPGSGLGVSPQLSMSSGRTIPGDLYATSSNGARRPCTAKSKQLFPPPGLQGYTQLPIISQDPGLRANSPSILAFPNLSHIILEDEAYRESFMTELTYSKICDAFRQTCLESSMFHQHYNSADFPSLKLLEYFVKLFFEHFDPIVPLVHPHTTDLNGNWVLALAICAIGSQYSATADIHACVVPFHEFLRRTLLTQLEGSELNLPLAQALVLSQAGLLYSGGSQLQKVAYERMGTLQRVMTFYHCRSDSQRDLLDHGEGDEDRWRGWVEDETWRRLCYFIWIAWDGTSLMTTRQQPHQIGRSSIAASKVRCISPLPSSPNASPPQANPTLEAAISSLFRERTAKTDLGEFSRILLLHAVYQEYTTVSTYCKRPLSSWIPQNNPEPRSDEIQHLQLSDSNWRNAALDCVDTLHWAANATIASLLGAEHPTVLHLHFSRVVLLVPRRAIITLAKYLKAPEDLRKEAASQKEALQAEREISEWAQQDGSKARLAALHCGCFLWHVRRYAKMTFYEPPCVFWATLTLWAYSVFCSKSRRPDPRSGSATRQISPDRSDDENPTFIRLDRPNDDEMVQLFVRTGVLKAYISGVGDIYSATAPKRILKEGKRVLESTIKMNHNYESIIKKSLNEVPGPLLVLPEGPDLSRVVVSQRELARYTKNSLQHDVLDLPGMPVTFMNGRVRWGQILGMRDGYINALLIQSRGTRAAVPCASCAKAMEKDRASYANPFPSCIRLPGHFGGSCGNCKWRDHALRCHTQEEAGAGAGSREEPVDRDDGGDDPVVVSDDDNLGVDALEDAGDFLSGAEDEKDMEMSLVPLPDDGSAGVGTQDDPIRID
ncbi:zinc finger zas1 [Fusarium sp. NRRL 52700]|nr:zinc finger zas1 [Fusarium sp. NRRL 52700]